MPDDLRERIARALEARAEGIRRIADQHGDSDGLRAAERAYREAARIARETPEVVAEPEPCLGSGCGIPTAGRVGFLPCCSAKCALDIDRRLRPEAYEEAGPTGREPGGPAGR